MQMGSNMSEGSSPIHFKVTPVKILAILIANTPIALFIIAIMPGGSFLVR